MIIAVDASGGEYAPYEIVKGAVKAAQEYEVKVALVGKRNILHVLASRYAKKTGISIVGASQVIGPHESPIRAIQSKPNSSIVVGINLVKEGKAQAFVSAGNSGAVAVAAMLNLGKIEGIPRSAIGSFINIYGHSPILLVDAGANADCRPEHLLWFARLGSVYVSRLLGIGSPRVGLLSNGEEASKGSSLVRESHKLLKGSELNFTGNIEGQDMMRGAVDVIVTDGFTGNIVLKTLEGLTDSWLYSLGQAGQVFAKAYNLPLRVLHRDIGMNSWAKRLDYQEYGGACLLGVNGNVIIAHGRSQAKAIKNAIRLAKETAEGNMAQILREVSHD
ncbi:MAG: phosphate acyltransferase PlsX [Chloroflexota bacterium]